MLKHATISRTSKTQQTLQLQRQWVRKQSHQQQLSEEDDGKSSPALLDVVDFGRMADNHRSALLNTCNNLIDTGHEEDWTSSSIGFAEGLQTPSPLPPSFPSFNNGCSPSINKLAFKTDVTKTHPANNNSSGRDSMIRVFAQSLSQEVEYVTLPVNSQTKSQQIIKSLLRKFRLKHRDPNLFYLTLERWIRKDGLKFKSVMLLGDEACPLQLQQCCSNPPHNDIKFTLQMRTGALVKIHCSDVVPDARYKCLSLSTQTTVEETIELMLHCLNIVKSPSSNQQQTTNNASTATNDRDHVTGSPSSTGSTSSNTSSSGIESDPTAAVPDKFRVIGRNHHNRMLSTSSSIIQQIRSDSRASSVASINSSSNYSSSSSNSPNPSELYCLVIECKDTNHQRVLEADEYLVDVYQNLLAESKQQLQEQQPISPTPDSPIDPTTHSQWFLIKLKRRVSCMASPAGSNIKFTNPRQNYPLPPIPMSLAQFDQSSEIVSTTEIEINRKNGKYINHNRKLAIHQQRPLTMHNPDQSVGHHNYASCDRLSTNLVPGNNLDHHGNVTSSNNLCDSVDKRPAPYEAAANDLSDLNRMPPPPPILSVWLPPVVTPRRRNLSNASSTFNSSPVTSRVFNGTQNTTFTGNGTLNRRRYDPAQLEVDLQKLDVVSVPDEPLVRSDSVIESGNSN